MVNFESLERYKMDDLVRIMEILRAPDGCPWDRVQTHQSIRRNMLEEAYEVAEAIDEMNYDHMKEELGDVLLQVVFHASMANSAGAFTLDDVVDGVCKKLVFRHPHLFGDVQADDPNGALNAWEAAKQVEKGQKTATDTLDAVARSLPALMRAEKIQSKAAKAGFDWKEIGPALDKLSEEVEELKKAVAENSNVEEELGKQLDIDPKRREGYTEGRWCVLDYGDVMVHVFHEQDREYYQLERLWADGTNEVELFFEAEDASEA